MYASFAVRVDHRSLNRAMAGIRSIRYAALGLGTVLGVGAVVKGMIGFNQSVEDAKLNIASMLALAKKTTVADQLRVASKLYDDIRVKASELPGTTQEYVAAMNRLALPLTRAGFSLEQLKELTVNTVVAAKGIGITSVAASVRDVQQFLEGRFASTDLFLSALFGSPDEARRKQLKSGRGEVGGVKVTTGGQKGRAELLHLALTQKQIEESAKLQSQTFSGQMDKTKEAAVQFLGAVGLPLFTALTEKMKELNKWAVANKKSIEDFAKSMGEKLKGALGVLVGVFQFLTSGSDTAKSVLLALKLVAIGVLATIAVGWITAFGPMTLMVGKLFVLIEMFKALKNHVGVVSALMLTAFSGAVLFNIGGIATKLKDLVKSKLGFSVANAAGAATGKIMNVSVINASMLNVAGGAGVGGLGGVGGVGTPATKAGKFANLARGAVAGLPYIGAAVMGHGLMDQYLPKEGALGKIASVGKWLASGPIALPKYAIGKVWDAVAGEEGKLGKGLQPYVNMPVTVTITGVETPEELGRKMEEVMAQANRNIMDAFSGGQR